jgi:hypothetical protein
MTGRKPGDDSTHSQPIYDERADMKQVKKTGEYTIYQKKSGRYAVKGKDKQLLHGEDKTRILLAEALIEPPKAKAPAGQSVAPESESAEPPAS